MSEALPAIPRLPCLEVYAGSSTLTSEGTSRAVGLVEVMRRAAARPSKKGPPQQILEAQDSLERRIRAHLSRGRVQVTLTDNRYTMISVRRITKERRFEVRLHHMFADADPVITRALARYIADNDPDASRVLGDFIDENSSHVRGRTRRNSATLIFTAGEFHDLRQIYDDLNARYFDNKIEAAITWGAKNGQPRRRNSIKMGSYSVEDRLIRIHRSLDRSFVPAFFVSWIVFHEMLHQVHDIRMKNGRREFHSKEFLADEAHFEHYDQAKTWERRHLDAILTY
ncbi:MAG: hypothetical protein H6Q90_1031 [Deltaproteobacteria bacterium]|nr:hypothetical protein [Deltaproteobacteria bacterium]